jgi:hypothetical protein
MTRIIRTSHAKNSTTPGMAYPATFLILATSAQLPAFAQLNLSPLGERSRLASCGLRRDLVCARRCEFTKGQCNLPDLLQRPGPGSHAIHVTDPEEVRP